MLRSWNRARGTRFLVYLILLVAVMDVSITWISIESFGVEGELNPLILHLYRAGLLPLWSVVAVVASLIGGATLVSISVVSTGRIRRLAALAFGGLLSVKLAALAISAGGCFGIPLIGLGGLLIGAMTFLVTKRHLTRGVSLDMAAYFWAVKDYAMTLVDTIANPLQMALVFHPRADMLPASDNHSQGRTVRRDTRKIIVAVTVAAVTIVILLSMLDLLQGHVFRSIPWWLRELGIVEGMQGQAFLIIFVATLLALAILTYCLLSIGEALGGSRE